jgi:hypothetical protein
MRRDAVVVHDMVVTVLVPDLVMTDVVTSLGHSVKVVVVHCNVVS